VAKNALLVTLSGSGSGRLPVATPFMSGESVSPGYEQLASARPSSRRVDPVLL